MFKDKIIVCKKCGTEFIFSENEQKFFSEKGLKNVPSWCKSCRTSEKEKRKKLYSAVCSECKSETKVPFIPDENRPVFCKECFEKMQK